MVNIERTANAQSMGYSRGVREEWGDFVFVGMLDNCKLHKLSLLGK